MTIPALLPALNALLALHVFSVIVWMAGMLVLPVIYLCHRALEPAGEAARSFVLLERQIFKRMVNPGMYAAWGFGVLLILTPGTISWSAPWWIVKFAAVLTLSWYHGVLSAWRRRLRDAQEVPSRVAMHLGIAAPICLAAIIVAMVIIKP